VRRPAVEPAIDAHCQPQAGVPQSKTHHQLMCPQAGTSEKVAEIH
jgi:hypothetical protein